jgi:hypothetical protein
MKVWDEVNTVNQGKFKEGRILKSLLDSIELTISSRPLGTCASPSLLGTFRVRL